MLDSFADRRRLSHSSCHETRSSILDRSGAAAVTDQKERAVPCGSCQACCRREWILLDPAAGDVIELYETEDVVNSRNGKTTKALAHKANGDCLYLGATGCTIHGYRPHLCRIFDCRVHYLNMMKKPPRERDRELREQFNVREMFTIGRDMLKKHPLVEE